ncbi:uncharacterized protein LOC127840182 isoform X2 [Dreissena polymorpha]|uniref:uncharacterized protein LOC127840182 isoform X2 n=1 Tax=Dreissena polymorpha TaxID=45954 RepID=UPI0022648279|nr:uncharacterized protein LOC127840182 isoform X2 [Dreissena polymorpha]
MDELIRTREQVKADLEDSKTSTRGILESLDQLQRHNGHVCRNSGALAAIDHELQVLSQRISLAEDSVRKNIERNSRRERMRKRFDNFQTQMDDLKQMMRDVEDKHIMNGGHIDSTHERVASSTGNDPVSQSTNGDEVRTLSTSGEQTNNYLKNGGLALSTYQQDSSDSAPRHVVTCTDIVSPDENIANELIHHTSSKLNEVLQIQNQQKTEITQQQQATVQIMDTKAWISLAKTKIRDEQLRTEPLEGYHTVLLLDISKSMASGNAWRQAKLFVNEFLEGLQEHDQLYPPPGLREHVAFATFGHKTELNILLTTDFSSIRDKMETMTLGGPSPLYGGLVMAIAGSKLSNNGAECTNNHRFVMRNKIIVVTDGRPTDTSKTIGPDVSDPQTCDQTTVDVIQEMQYAERQVISVFYVGVGDYNKDFLEIVASGTQYRTLYSYTDGRRLSRRNFLCRSTEFSEISRPGLVGVYCSYSELTSEDLEDVHEMHMESRIYHKRIERERMRPPLDKYLESSNARFPVIGTRVIRGPDWHYEDQDKNKPGTIVGHAVDECSDPVVWVQWDANDVIQGYQYGARGFDVLISDEKRQLRPGEVIAVGCEVKPSQNAKIEGVRAWNTGVVIRVNPPRAHVRWNTGKRGDYLYGVDGRPEIELSSLSDERGTLSAEEPVSKRKLNKNKRKMNS